MSASEVSSAPCTVHGRGTARDATIARCVGPARVGVAMGYDSACAGMMTDIRNGWKYNNKIQIGIAGTGVNRELEADWAREHGGLELATHSPMDRAAPSGRRLHIPSIHQHIEKEYKINVLSSGSRCVSL